MHSYDIPLLTNYARHSYELQYVSPMMKTS